MSTNAPNISATTVPIAFSQDTVAPAPSLLPQCIGFFFAFRLFFALLAVRLFGREAQDGVAASLFLNYLLLALAIFHCFGRHAPVSQPRLLQVPCIRWVVLFLGFAGLSLLWSGTASMPAAVAFWCAMVADTAAVLLLLCSGSVDAVVEAIMKGFVWGASAIAIAGWLMPSQSDLRLGDEELLGPNQIGYVCAFAFFFAQYLTRRGRDSWSGHALLLGVTLLRSLSKTTIIAFLAGQGYILLRDRSISRRTKWLLALSTVLVVAMFSTLLANYIDIYTNAGSQAETLTGRIGIWAYFLNEAVQQPWAGHGFHSVWKVIPPFGPDSFEARHAHNEVLQQFYAYGAMGVVMLAGIYGSVFRSLSRLRDDSVRPLLLGMLVFALVRGLADTEAFDLSLPMWTIAMFGYLVVQSQDIGEVSA